MGGGGIDRSGSALARGAAGGPPAPHSAQVHWSGSEELRWRWPSWSAAGRDMALRTLPDVHLQRDSAATVKMMLSRWQASAQHG
mmetsp:Transcript_45521/g.126671  ORF Transcript_45521/g.126671 Transcript_45521/m.126671 type:complete len:84 (+) Transcript_45521:213-464(+)